MKRLAQITLMFAFLVMGLQATATDVKEEVRTIEIIGTDNMKFDVTSIEAAPGEKITIKYTTDSEMPKVAMAHNVVVIDKDADLDAVAQSSMMARDNEYISKEYEGDIIAATGLAGGGETVEVTFTVPETSGEYPYICTFPGHYMAGMKGVLKVK